MSGWSAERYAEIQAKFIGLWPESAIRTALIEVCDALDAAQAQRDTLQSVAREAEQQLQELEAAALTFMDVAYNSTPEASYRPFYEARLKLQELLSRTARTGK